MNGNVLCNRGKRGQWEQEKHGLAETELGKQRERECVGATQLGVET